MIRRLDNNLSNASVGTEAVDAEKAQPERPAPAPSAETTTTSAAPSASGGAARMLENSLTARTTAFELASALAPPAFTKTAAIEAAKRDFLTQGDKGPGVKSLQIKLNEWRTAHGKPEIKVDEKFGPETEAAVRDFQKATGLKNDGLAGPNVESRLTLENDKNFQSLPDETKDKVRSQMNGYQKNPEARANLLGVATSPSFAGVPKEARARALGILAENPSVTRHAANVQESLDARAYVENHSTFKGLPEDAKNKVRAQFDSYAGDPDKTTNLGHIATDSNFAKLTSTQQDQVLRAYQAAPGMDSADNLRRIMNNDSFDKMDEATKTRVLGMAERNIGSAEMNKQLGLMLSENNFSKLSVQEQNKALNVFENTTPAGRTALIQLTQKEINGAPALQSKTIDGKSTLLDQLDRLATTPLDGRIKDIGGNPQDKTKVTEGLLQELARPNQNINQDNRGTCTVTSMTNTLANQNPAEYARLSTDLATTGQAKLANGDTIQPPADGFAQDNSNRTTSERLLQSSLMRYGQPTYQNWNPGADGVRGTPDDGFSDPTNPTAKSLDGVPPNGGGLGADDNRKVMQGLYGQKVDRYTDKMVDRAQKAIADGKGPVFTGIRWGGGNHAIEITKIENGRVYFRNPWGPGAMGPKGSTQGTAANNTNAGPLRREDDPSEGIESMSIEDFNKCANDIIVRDKKL